MVEVHNKQYFNSLHAGYFFMIFFLSFADFFQN